MGGETADVIDAAVRNDKTHLTRVIARYAPSGRARRCGLRRHRPFVAG
ncbi:hypothetical protein ACFPRL_15835 [Pseudoclavibacter helvolus]